MNIIKLRKNFFDFVLLRKIQIKMINKIFIINKLIKKKKLNQNEKINIIMSHMHDGSFVGRHKGRGTLLEF
jgi:hypothetical protein